jgi:hypothetical protein
LRRASDEALVMLLQTRGVYRVGKNGVSFRVSGTTLTYGASSAALRRYAGRDVLITLDEEDCSCCHAFTAERGGRRFIGQLACNVKLRANTPAEQLREAIRKVRGRRKIMVTAAREGAARGRTAAQEVAAMQREELQAAYRATGTDDHRPNIVPVRTGLEGVSRPVQSSFEVVCPDAGDLDDFLSDDDTRDDGATDARSYEVEDSLSDTREGDESNEASSAFP